MDNCEIIEIYQDRLLCACLLTGRHFEVPIYGRNV